MPSFAEIGTTADLIHAHRHGVIDPEQPIQFENGKEAFLHGILSGSGKCKMVRTGTSTHAEMWAELYEMGGRFLVHAEATGGQAYLYDKHGNPMDVSDVPKGKYRIVNPDLTIAVGKMEEIPGWGLFG